MHKMNKIGLVLTTFLSVMIFTGCSKDNVESLDEDIILGINENEVIDEVQDEDEVIVNTAPEFYSQNFWVDENVDINYSVGFLKVTDKENHSVEFFIQGGSGPFSVNEITGEITVSSNDIDFEVEENYEFVVAADDGEFSVKANISISINEVLE